jgi:hypothetical protein
LSPWPADRGAFPGSQPPSSTTPSQDGEGHGSTYAHSRTLRHPSTESREPRLDSGQERRNRDGAMIQFLLLVVLPFFAPGIVAMAYAFRAGRRYERFLERVSDWRAPTSDDLAGRGPLNMTRTVWGFVRQSDQMDDAVMSGAYGEEGQRLLAEVVSRRRLVFLSVPVGFLLAAVVLPALVPHSYYVVGLRASSPTAMTPGE